MKSILLSLMIRGNIPCLQRLLGNTALFSSPNDRANNSVIEDAHYLPQPVLHIMVDLLKQLTYRKIDKLVNVYENWLSSLASEEPLEDNVLVVEE